MKALVEFPGGICHITQARLKRVKARPDVVEAPGDSGALMLHDRVQFPADYFEVLDVGFCEAR